MLQSVSPLLNGTEDMPYLIEHKSVSKKAISHNGKKKKKKKIKMLRLRSFEYQRVLNIFIALTRL